MQIWERTRSSLLKRIPIGVALAPFEFGVAVTWLIYGIRLLIDDFTAGPDPLRAALPLSGTEFAFWSALLPASALFMILGLIGTAVAPVAGLYVERVGLLGMLVAIFTFIYALVEHAHISIVSLTSLNSMVTAAMIVLRFVIVGNTLDTVRRRLDVERADLMHGISAGTIFLLAAWVAIAVFARDMLGFFRKWRKRMTAEEREALRAPIQFNKDAVALQSAVLRDVREELARKDGRISQLEQENAALKAERQELYTMLGQIRTQRYKEQGEKS